MRALLLVSFSAFSTTLCLTAGKDVSANQDVAKDDNEDAVKHDLDRLRGEWQCVKMEANGRPIESPEGRPVTVTFESGKVIFAQKGPNGEEGKGPATPVKVGPNCNPKEIDIGEKGDIKGIYAIDGDMLKLMHVIAKRGQAIPKIDRPKEFKSKADDGYVYMELKRLKQ